MVWFGLGWVGLVWFDLVWFDSVWVRRTYKILIPLRWPVWTLAPTTPRCLREAWFICLYTCLIPTGFWDCQFGVKFSLRPTSVVLISPRDPWIKPKRDRRRWNKWVICWSCASFLSWDLDTWPALPSTVHSTQPRRATQCCALAGKAEVGTLLCCQSQNGWHTCRERKPVQKQVPSSVHGCPVTSLHWGKWELPAVFRLSEVTEPLPLAANQPRLCWRQPWQIQLTVLFAVCGCHSYKASLTLIPPLLGEGAQTHFLLGPRSLLPTACVEVTLGLHGQHQCGPQTSWRGGGPPPPFPQQPRRLFTYSFHAQPCEGSNHSGGIRQAMWHVKTPRHQGDGDNIGEAQQASSQALVRNTKERIRKTFCRACGKHGRGGTLQNLSVTGAFRRELVSSALASRLSSAGENALAPLVDFSPWVQGKHFVQKRELDQQRQRVPVPLGGAVRRRISCLCCGSQLEHPVFINAFNSVTEALPTVFPVTLKVRLPQKSSELRGIQVTPAFGSWH